jgi:hypothetical protein
VEISDESLRVKCQRQFATEPQVKSLIRTDNLTILPRGHPLGVAVGDQPAAAVGVLVPEDAVDHVGDGLEAPVGCQGVPLGSPGA